MKIKTFFALALLFALSSTVQAQLYNTGIGGRLGFPAGLSYKQFVSRTLALEGIAGMSGIGSDTPSFSATVLFENHSEVFMENLSLFYGGGGHLGTYKGAFEFGADGIIGLEFVFDGAPIAFSFDFKPALSITRNIAFTSGGAFTLRYVF